MHESYDLHNITWKLWMEFQDTNFHKQDWPTDMMPNWLTWCPTDLTWCPTDWHDARLTDMMPDWLDMMPDWLTWYLTDWHDAQLTDMMMPIYPPPSLTSIVESIIIISRSHLLYLHSSNQSQIITPVQGIYRRFKFKPSFVDKIDFSHNFIFYLSCVDF